MAAEDALHSPPTVPAVTPASDRPVVIEARDIAKRFRVPQQRVDSLKERVLHPMAHRNFHVFEALSGVSFDIHEGEFFGIVGRNGSGKSTLLKILASIYRADSGTLRMAGRVAPFIELGVGFNPDLTARENVALNGVMMGLPRAEARRRLAAVLEFAELEEFVDLKLKNYSSGMLVRLAFSVMIQSDADVLLIDEILAVGDAAFQQKCADVFHDMRDQGRTLILVTHDMSTVREYCDRAMLLDSGELVQIGAPGEVGRRYLRLNFERPQERSESAAASVEPSDVRLVDIWVENAQGERVTNIEEGADILITAIVEARRDVPGPVLGLVINNADGVFVFTASTKVTPSEGSADELSADTRIQLTARIENRLNAGHYFVDFAVHRNHNHLDNALWVAKALDFVIFGSHGLNGLVRLTSDLKTVPLDS